MFSQIAACGEAFFIHTHMPHGRLKGGLGPPSLVPANNICTEMVGVVSADMEKFLRQCICALRDRIFGKRGNAFRTDVDIFIQEKQMHDHLRLNYCSVCNRCDLLDTFLLKGHIIL